MNDHPTKPEVENMILKNSDKERQESDKSYAIKLVERVVWGLVGLILTGVAVALISLVIDSSK